jgi:single-strand DNA-binding protein
MSNVVSFTGTIGRDAEVRYLPSGQAVLNVSVANNVGFGDRQQTLWFRVVLWGKRAEGNLKDYLLKGQQVFISGEMTQSEYQAKDGTMKTVLEVNANIVDLVGKRSENGHAQQPQQQQHQHQQQRYQTDAQKYDELNRQKSQQPSHTQPYDDDVPF